MHFLKRFRLINILFLFLAIAVMQPAFAHAKLQTESPAVNAILATSPDKLELTFSEAIELSFSNITVTDAEKTPVNIAKPVADATNPNQISVQLMQTLKAGTYNVEWNVLSVDGHKTNGSYTFTVK